ncbi:MAG TPA: hypothetical protein VKN36_03035 [Eudoraea sp.]|nr:hypothetical protein [Eudoraea sp.]
MDLEEIKAIWSDMSDQLEQQKKLTNEIIIKMTQERYSNKFQKITIFESMGAVVCFIAAFYIIINFDKLDTWYLVVCGVITLVFMLVLPILVLRSLHQIRNLNITESSYRDTVVNYERIRRNLLMQQQFGIYGSFVIFFTTLAIFSRISSGEDIFQDYQDTGVYIFGAIVCVLLYFFARWGYGCYKSITSSAESIIKELE